MSLSTEARHAADETTITTQELDELRDSSDDSSSSSDDDDSTEDNGHAELRQEPALKRHSSNRDPASRTTHYQPNLNLGNDSWELLKGGLENDERAVPTGHFDQNGSVSSWKSARNGGRQNLEMPDIADGSLCECSSPSVIVGRVLKHSISQLEVKLSSLA